VRFFTVAIRGLPSLQFDTSNSFIDAAVVSLQLRLATTAAILAVALPSLAEPAPTSNLQSPSLRQPWLDNNSKLTLQTMWPTPRQEHHPIAAAATLGAMYAGFTTWTYFAWYRKHKPLSAFAIGGDGWLGDRTYAGGADKFGHAWATMGLARAGTEMLRQWGGYSRLTSAVIGTALSETLFFLIEVKDGFYYEFSVSDFTGNSLGAALAFALSMSPRFDELFDFRVQYFPSKQYRRQFENGNVNVAEDYSGETFMAALHLNGIHSLRDSQWGGWSKFVDLTVGFGTRGYKPTPAPGTSYPHQQLLSVGVSLNAQGLFDWLLDGKTSRSAKTAKAMAHGVFEVLNLPYTNVPAIEVRRSPTGSVNNGGA
jgi:hypothetical protein